MNGILDQPGAYNSGSLGVAQPGAYRSGSLGWTQPGAYQSGSLGFVQPGAFRSGSLGMAQPGAYNSGSLGCGGGADKCGCGCSGGMKGLGSTAKLVPQAMAGLGRALGALPVTLDFIVGFGLVAGGLYLARTKLGAV
jgi:hypothetical protein